jgi:hypothetical protein
VGARVEPIAAPPAALSEGPATALFEEEEDTVVTRVSALPGA